MYTTPVLEFHNQGRREANVEQTFHEDILDRPLINILSARLVRKEDNYYVIGEIQNVDNDPAFINIKANLYDSKGKEIVSYNAKDEIVHVLYPKEKTPFKVSFEAVAWDKSYDKIPSTYDPDLVKPFDFLEEPVEFVVFASSSVESGYTYKNYGLQNISIEPDGSSLQGEFYNYGTKHVSIPQLLVTYLDENREVIWIDNHYQSYGARQQRKEAFEMDIDLLTDFTLVKQGDRENLFVNGSSIEKFAGLYSPNINRVIDSDAKVDNECYDYLRIVPNAFVGNP